MRAFFRIVMTVIFFSSIASSQLLAGTTETVSMTPSVFDQFNQEQVLKVELSLDIEALHANKKSNEYMPATFSISDEQSSSSWSVKVRARGRFRRVKSEFPPLKLKFSKKELIAKGLSEDNEYKLVTHFFDSKQGDDAVLREYLAYKLYNQLSDQSYRVQLAEVTYRDQNTNKTTTRYGILIEDADQLSKRLQGKICDECFNYPEASYNAENIQLHALFQYMIGNTDWSVKMNRNLKVMKLKNTGKYIAVPYDFDFSGFVNASYALPNIDYKLTSVRDRAFLGSDNLTTELKQAKTLMISKRGQLENTVNNFKVMSKKSRKDIIEYLDSFYTALETQPNL